MRPAIVTDAPVSYWPVLEINSLRKLTRPSFPLFSKMANDGDVQPRLQGFPYKNGSSHFFLKEKPWGRGREMPRGVLRQALCRLVKTWTKN